MSTSDVLETRKDLGSVGITLWGGPTFLPPNRTKIMADYLVVGIENSLITPPVLARLRRMEDNTYKLPDEWNVHPTQLFTLYDLIRSSRQPKTFDEISSVLALSSQSRLDLPGFYDIAKESLSSFFPHTPTPYYEFGQLEEALILAIEHDVKPIRKTLYYALITHTDIGVEDSSETAEIHPALSSHPEIVKTAQHLQTQLISHFTPILFTVSTAGHMACTDAFAEHWMTSVIGPALSDPTGGVNAPIEALEKLRELDWVGLGLCEECVRDKREEWKAEMGTIWEKMDEWLSMP